MKAFNQFLVDLNDGSTHAGLTADLAELFAAVQTAKANQLNTHKNED